MEVDPYWFIAAIAITTACGFWMGYWAGKMDRRDINNSTKDPT